MGYNSDELQAAIFEAFTDKFLTRIRRLGWAPLSSYRSWAQAVDEEKHGARADAYSVISPLRS